MKKFLLLLSFSSCVSADCYEVSLAADYIITRRMEGGFLSEFIEEANLKYDLDSLVINRIAISAITTPRTQDPQIQTEFVDRWKVICNSVVNPTVF